MTRVATYIISTIALVVLMSSCGTRQVKDSSSSTYLADADTIRVNYAKGFTVLSKGEVRFVEINDLNEHDTRRYKYALVPRGAVADSIPEEYQIIRTPVQRIICMTTLQLSSLLKLEAYDKVVGLTSTRYLHNDSIKSRLESGAIRRIGIEGEFDIEVVMDAKPELIFTSSFKRGGYTEVANIGVTTFDYMGYKESSPLGHAEWIRLVGMLIGLEEQAEEIFEGIESRYLHLKGLTEGVAHRPKVMSGELHSGSWYVVGGESYLAQLFRDAGGDYFMKNDKKLGGFYVDYESVYAQGYDSDYWRIANSYNGEFTYDTLLSSDSRYGDFKPFRDRGVIYCNLRSTPFYERIPMEPDVVLADLINIFHPSLLHEHQPIYYKQLK